MLNQLIKFSYHLYIYIREVENIVKVVIKNVSQKCKIREEKKKHVRDMEDTI